MLKRLQGSLFSEGLIIGRIFASEIWGGGGGGIFGRANFFLFLTLLLLFLFIYLFFLAGGGGGRLIIEVLRYLQPSTLLRKITKCTTDLLC